MLIYKKGSDYMNIVGIICEYNPFHNGHIYHLKKVKELYPNSLIVLILNGYFLERGEISIESKEEKTKLALNYGVDLVIEHPFLFSSSSADIFASSALELLNELKVKTLIFGSETDNIDILTKIVKEQIKNEHKLEQLMKKGINYPTALNKITESNITKPNDLLAISYIKAILKNNYKITPISIKRTNDYLDIESDDDIVSASNIRYKIKNGMNIKKYIPEGKINDINEKLLFTLLKYKIITEDSLNKYLTVDEGLDNRLKKVINSVNSIEELIMKTKSKRYTYNRIRRMLIHILIGLTKQDKLEHQRNEYIRILGMSKNGQTYLNSIKKDVNLPIVTKFNNNIIRNYELKCAQIYKILTNDDVLTFELSNKPIKKED